MEINPTTPTQNPISASTPAQGSNEISSDFETFLKMLTVQLENQDPLSPVSSEDFAVQLATFSGVEQQVLTNDLLTSMQSQLAVSGMSQFASWVGMEARAPVAGFFNGSPITVATNADQTADSANLIVKNEFGTEVQRVPIDMAQELLQWNGTNGGVELPKGLYTFEIESISNGVATSTKTAEIYTTISEARVQDGSTVLITAGGVQVGTDEISALRSIN